MATLTLFRGDAEKIKTFDFNKTDKSCAVGQGIYLTNNLKVAQSYRDKGSNKRNVPSVLFQGDAKDRNDAYEKAFEVFVREKIRTEKLVSGSHPLYWKKHEELDKANKALLAKLMEKFRPEFLRLREEGRVVAEYSGAAVWGAKSRYLTVTLDVKEFEVGYITEFQFEEAVFNPTMFKVEGREHHSCRAE